MPPAEPEPDAVPPAEPEPDAVPPAEPEPDTVSPAEPEPDTVSPAEPEPDAVPPAEPEPDTLSPAEHEPDTVSPAEPEPDTVSPAEPEPDAVPPAEHEPDAVPPAEHEPDTAPIYELLSSCGRVLFTATLFKQSGLVHNNQMTEDEACYLIKSLYLNVIPKTGFKFDADFHCQGAPIAWLKSRVRLKKMTITNPKSKKARKGKNQVVTILVGERDRISSTQTSSQQSCNETASPYNANDKIDLFWSSYHIATGHFHPTNDDTDISQNKVLVEVQNVYTHNLNHVDRKRRASIVPGKVIPWPRVETELHSEESVQLKSKRKSEKKRVGPEEKRETKRLKMTKFDEPMKQCQCKRLSCFDKFSIEEQISMREEYWNIETYEEKNLYLARLLDKEHKHRTTNLNHKKREREYNKIYHLPKDDALIRVCKVMFEETFGVSQKKCAIVLKKKEEMSFDHERKNKISSNITKKEVRKKVKSHIEKFPSVSSHYRRKYTGKRYFEHGLTVAKMYNAFREENPGLKISLSTYKKIVDQYNIGFHKPKNDKCGICTQYENSTKTDADIENYTRHRKFIDDSRLLQKKDKARAQVDPSFEALVCDMEAVRPCPKSPVSAFFYVTKISCYNYTVYSLGSHNVTCYTWNSGGRGKQRGADEISSALYHYILGLSGVPSLEEVVVWSDTCSGQNRNQYLCSLLIRLLREAKYLKKITLKYFTPGHNQSECDNVHSVLERKIKSVEVYNPNDMKVLMRSAKYNVESLGENHCPIYDVKQSSKDIIVNRNKYKLSDGKVQTVSWMKNKINILEKTTMRMSETYDESDCVTVNIDAAPTATAAMATRQSGKTRLPKLKIKPPGGENPKTISKLVQLCHKGQIPNEYVL